MSRSSVSQTPCSARTKRRRSSLVGKSAQASAESNKLIMISRVPGYGRFEYLVIEYHVNLNMLPLIKAIGFLMSIFNWD